MALGERTPWCCMGWLRDTGEGPRRLPPRPGGRGTMRMSGSSRGWVWEWRPRLLTEVEFALKKVTGYIPSHTREERNSPSWLPFFLTHYFSCLGRFLKTYSLKKHASREGFAARCKAVSKLHHEFLTILWKGRRASEGDDFSVNAGERNGVHCVDGPGECASVTAVGLSEVSVSWAGFFCQRRLIAIRSTQPSQLQHLISSEFDVQFSPLL